MIHGGGGKMRLYTYRHKRYDTERRLEYKNEREQIDKGNHKLRHFQKRLKINDNASNRWQMKTDDKGVR